MNSATIISVVAGIVAVIASAVIGIYQGDKTTTGVIIAAGAMTLVGLSAVILLFINLQQAIERSLSKRLPQFTFLTEASEIISELQSAVRQARRFIYVTGSAGRDRTYLELIERRISALGVSYIRVLYYRHVSAPLQEHLLGLVDSDKVQVLYADEAHHGYFTITENTAILRIPNRNFEGSVAIKFDGEAHRDVFQATFSRLLALSEPIKSAQQLRDLYEKLKGIGH